MFKKKKTVETIIETPKMTLEEAVIFPEHAPYYIKHEDWKGEYNFLYSQASSHYLSRLLKISSLDPKDLCFIKDGYVLAQIVEGYYQSELSVLMSRHLQEQFVKVGKP